MDIKDKLLFVNVFDLMGNYHIIKSKTKLRYRPRVEIYGMNIDVVAFMSRYFEKNLPLIHVKTTKESNLIIDDNRNVLPLLIHIHADVKFNLEVVSVLKKFILYRTEVEKKRYDSNDENFFKMVCNINE